MMRKRGAMGALSIVVAGLAACGDPATNDTRGYTKAPLESPSVVVTPEPAPTFAGMEGPVRPEVVDPNELASRQQQAQAQ